jgi:hypothetical protein
MKYLIVFFALLTACESKKPPVNFFSEIPAEQRYIFATCIKIVEEVDKIRENNQKECLQKKEQEKVAYDNLKSKLSPAELSLVSEPNRSCVAWFYGPGVLDMCQKFFLKIERYL